MVGEVPLTPVQHWLFDNVPDSPGHFTQSLSFQLAAEVDEGALRAALAAVLEHHDALRMGYEATGDGHWRQYSATPGAAPALEVHDLSRRAPQERAAELRALTRDLCAGFDLAGGPLLKTALCHLGDQDRPVLLLAAHHLVVDAVSWRIILEDLDTAYRRGAGRGPGRARPQDHLVPRLGAAAARPHRRRRLRRRTRPLERAGRPTRTCPPTARAATPRTPRTP